MVKPASVRPIASPTDDRVHRDVVVGGVVGEEVEQDVDVEGRPGGAELGHGLGGAGHGQIQSHAEWSGRELDHPFGEGDRCGHAERRPQQGGARHDVSHVSESVPAHDLRRRPVHRLGERDRHVSHGVRIAAGDIDCRRQRRLGRQGGDVGGRDVADVHEVAPLATVLEHPGRLAPLERRRGRSIATPA